MFKFELPVFTFNSAVSFAILVFCSLGVITIVGRAFSRFSRWLIALLIKRGFLRNGVSTNTALGRAIIFVKKMQLRFSGKGDMPVKTIAAPNILFDELAKDNGVLSKLSKRDKHDLVFLLDEAMLRASMLRVVLDNYSSVIEADAAESIIVTDFEAVNVPYSGGGEIVVAVYGDRVNEST